MALLPSLLPAHAQHHTQQLIAHRRSRSLALGPRMWLQFEDDLTVHHQIHEVLAAAPNTKLHAQVQREIDTCAQLRPDGSNWKATLLVALPATSARERELPPLHEATRRLYVEVAQHPRVHARANPALPDRPPTGLSAVHFLCFQFPEPLRVALLAGASATLGCAHDQYAFRRLIPLATLEHLRCDLATRRRT